MRIRSISQSRRAGTGGAFFLLLIVSGGCVHPFAAAGRDADSGISAFRTNMRDLNAALVQARTDIHAGENVQQNDPWTMRLLGLGIMVLGLSYPVGKLIWIAMMSMKDRAKSGASLMPMSHRSRKIRCDELMSV
jgi:hypothetical protein